MFNANIIVSPQGSRIFIIGGSHVHVVICELHATPNTFIYINIYFLDAKKNPESRWQRNGATLIEQCWHFARRRSVVT